MKRRSTQGFTLIELMISVVLGLVVIGGVVSVLLANKRSYSTNEGLGQIQESARTAFELMARDIRQAGANGCDNNNRVGNVIAAGGQWWSTWYGVTGIDGAATDPAVADGTTAGLRVAGTDSIHVQSVQGVSVPVQLHNATATTMRFAALTPFVVGDVLVACDVDHSTMFRATAVTTVTPFTVTHAATGSNCSSGLGFPTVCDSGAGTLHPFPINSQVSRVTASAWYIGNNERAGESGRSLYRVRLNNGGVEVTEEIVSGVTDMQLRYGLNGSQDIIEADDAAMDWARVNSVFVTLLIDSADANVSTDPTENSGRIQRPFNYLITLRNRVP